MTLTKVSYAMISGTPINIVDMGAVGDGVTDNTAVIQAALDLNLTEYRPIYFPPGVYLTGPLTFTAATLNPNYVPALTMFGYNAGGQTNPDVVPYTEASIIKTTATSGSLFTASGNTILLTPVEMTDLQFVGPDPVATSGPVTTVNGLVFTTSGGSGTKLRFDNVSVSGFGGIGVKLDWVENSLIEALTVNYCGTGVVLTGATNANVFNFLEVQENFTVGLKLESGLGNSFITPLVQGNKKTGLWIQGAESTAFVAPYFEANNYLLDANSYSIYVKNSGDGVYLTNHVTISDAVINPNNSGTNAGIYLDSNGGAAYAIDGFVFENCRCRQNTNPNCTFTGERFTECSISNSGFNLQTLNNAVVESSKWQTWTPTITNATANSGATAKFEFLVAERNVQLYVAINNYNVTASGEIRISPPNYLNYNGPLIAFDNTGTNDIYAWYDNSLQVIRVIKSFGTNWSAGNTVNFVVQGSYPTLLS